MNPLTVHVVFHAHLDPVWMWPWTAGLDEALGTARSACDRLDESPRLFYTQGEAWTLQMAEKADPGLFGRIRKHVEAGRWEIVNGWWVQPDCNFPTADGLRRQIEVGQKWVWEKFRVKTRCGFNPDSFGHCAILPEILREHGQDRYVFMRPQEHEMDLPARVFNWRTRAGGPGVTVFRIADSYLNGQGKDVWQPAIEHGMASLPEGCRHTMVFFGVGDHGGGPTQWAVRWVEEHRDALAGARLEFSTVGRFFDAIEQEKPQLPEVVGELQMHAVGCYSVVRANKVAMRRAEHALLRAETVATEDERPQIERAWQQVTAHQFHDTMGGTCIPEAYTFVDGQLNGAAALADEMTAYAVRRQMLRLPDDKLPRLVLANPGKEALAGWAEGTIYVEGVWTKPWRLLDEAGREVPFQVVPTSVGTATDWFWQLRRVLVKTEIPAGGLKSLRLDLADATPLVPQVRASAADIANTAGAGVTYDGPSEISLRWNKVISKLDLHLIEDLSDTWTHNADRYGETPVAQALWQPPRIQDHGPLMASMVQEGKIGQSQLTAEWRVYAGEPWVELILDVLWAETQKVLKLVLPGRGGASRVDGTPGMAVTRGNSGREVPVHDWTLWGGLGVVSVDTFAQDATPERLRLTLLRAAYMAHHIPCDPTFGRRVVADQGRHRFRMRFWLDGAGEAALAAHALQLHRPPIAAELTRGMPARFTEYGPGGEVRK